jgi:hypothetical protein
MLSTLKTLVMALLTALTALGQDPSTTDDAGSDLRDFQLWLQEYRSGAFRLVREGRTDDTAVQQVEDLMQRVARHDSLPAAQMLFDAASAAAKPPGARSSTDLVDFNQELQPWRIQAMACRHLRGMKDAEVLPWLLAKLTAKGLRDRKVNQAQRDAAAVLRVLGGHPSVEAKLALLKACMSMPTELRIKAVSAMANDATLETAPTLIDLLRDSEPNVRIAAADALGSALSQHTDETQGAAPAADVLQLRDDVIDKLGKLLARDKIWQVRSAAAFALARMKCKAVIPVLIDGLDAELRRKKDPWAMDVRLHKILQGLTGQKVVQGSIVPWRAFWKAEGASFTVARAVEPGQKPEQDNRYQRFFNLEIQSDRVLFVLDFSGSMAEPVELETATTAANAGVKTTKAELVVSEIEKLVMSLPDGALVNIIVFSQDVRVWRQEGSRPALVRLDDESRDDLLGNFLPTLRPDGPTNLYGALAKALDFGGRGLHDKYYEAGFDTLYVITDGAPTAGEITDKDEIRRRVREVNGLRKIAIHCVTFGNQNDVDFLRPLAEENGGRHVHVQ